MNSVLKVLVPTVMTRKITDVVCVFGGEERERLSLSMDECGTETW